MRHALPFHTVEFFRASTDGISQKRVEFLSIISGLDASSISGVGIKYIQANAIFVPNTDFACMIDLRNILELLAK